MHRKQVPIVVETPMAARKDPNRIPVLAWSVNEVAAKRASGL